MYLFIYFIIQYFIPGIGCIHLNNDTIHGYINITNFANDATGY